MCFNKSIIHANSAIICEVCKNCSLFRANLRKLSSQEIVLSTTRRPWIGINSDVPNFDLAHLTSIDNKSLINEFILLSYPLSALIIDIFGWLIFEMSAADTFESWIFAFVMMISSGFPAESTQTCRFMPLILTYTPWFSCFHQCLFRILTVLNARFDYQWPQ